MERQHTQPRRLVIGRTTGKRIGSLDHSERRQIAVRLERLGQRGPRMEDPKIIGEDRFLCERLLRAHAVLDDDTPRGAA